MRIFKTPGIVKHIFPQLVWQKPAAENTIYLTFDDGPIPEITHFVLEQLAAYQAKATFFCVGDNLHKYPEIAAKTLSEGHKIGNHTFNHLNGWKNNTEVYLENIRECQSALNRLLPDQDEKLFRPPYGKLTFPQARYLLKNNYRVIMWDVLSYDFDAALSPENCLKNSINCTTNGSIIVFHDSQKAARNMQYVLPRFLQHFSEKGFKFGVL